ncbi:MAG: AraC family transcriptional regulator [Gemmatimonadaceae bacterium]
MNCVNILLQTDRATLSEFHHPVAHEHADPDVEVASCDSVNFVDGGTFDVTMSGESRRIDPGMVFLAVGGMSFSCRHQDAIPTDRCLTVAYADDAVEELRRADLPGLAPPAIPLSARLTFLRHRLRGCAPMDDIRFDLLAGSLFEAAGGRRPAPRTRRPGEMTDLMRRIDRAVGLIEHDFASALTLRQLANAAGLSPYHFAREFKALAGMPPHRYLTAVRLRHAARMLLGGASVSLTCYDVGFCSLSHFVTAFRRRYGIVPSAVRRGAPLPVLRASLSTPVWAGVSR